VIIMANTSRTHRTDEVRKAVNSATEQLRTPLLAALGAGNLASQAVADVVAKAKERVTETGEAARKNIEELPTDVTTLRERLDPAELRKVIDDYTDAALKLYNKLAETGEQAWDRFLAEPRVKDVLKQVEEVLHTAQDRIGEVGAEAKEKVEDVLGTVSKKARAGGEKVAEASESAAGKVEHAPTPAKPAPKSTPRATSGTRRTSSAAKKPSGGSATSK
jgi:heparin binding hemagglutinin HbhA